MALQTRNVFGTFEKRAPVPTSRARFEGPEEFSDPESHNKNLKAVLSHNFNTNKDSFHAKFNPYTLLSF